LLDVTVNVELAAKAGLNVMVMGTCRFWPTDTLDTVTVPPFDVDDTIKVRVTEACCWGNPLSETTNVTLVVLRTVAVPEITPAVLKVNPAGSGVLALTAQVYGAVPPEAASCTGVELEVRYAVFTTAMGSDCAGMVNGAGAMVRARVAVAWSLAASVTVTLR
jgi:hypothetical protein